jgi:hypothetical protein
MTQKAVSMPPKFLTPMETGFQRKLAMETHFASIGKHDQLSGFLWKLHLETVPSVSSFLPPLGEETRKPGHRSRKNSPKKLARSSCLKRENNVDCKPDS